MISNCTFTSNQALEADGGAIKFQCDNDDCQTVIKNNTFTSNFAKTKGGAISWNRNEPDLISNNTYTSNIAEGYGDDVAGIAEYLKVISEEEYKVITKGLASNRRELESVLQKPHRHLANFTIDNHQSGQVLKTFYIAVFDRYENVVTFGAQERLDARAVYYNGKFPTSIAGTTSFLLTNGATKVEGLELFSTPNTTQKVEIVYSDTIKFTLTVDVRPCKIGEELLSTGACSYCQGPNYYSIEHNFTEEVKCKNCPPQAKCLGGAQIFPLKNYWRSSNTTDKLYL